MANPPANMPAVGIRKYRRIDVDEKTKNYMVWAFIVGFFVGIWLAVFVFNRAESNQIKAGYFQRDGRAYKITPLEGEPNE